MDPEPGLTPQSVAAAFTGRGGIQIGQAAALAGLTTRAIRHYHTIGVLPEPARSDNGYRCYRLRDLVLLMRARWLVDQGMSLADVGKILAKDQRQPVLSVLVDLKHALLAQQQSLQQQCDRVDELMATAAHRSRRNRPHSGE